MSKSKYQSTFSCQMEATLSIILQIFLAAQAVWKIGEYHLDILGHVQWRDAIRQIDCKSRENI